MPERRPGTPAGSTHRLAPRLQRGNRRADILYMRMRVKKAEDVLVGRKRVEWLKRHGIPPPPPALTGQQKLEIEECFRLLDEDGSGGLDADELYEAFHDLGFRPNRREILDVLRRGGAVHVSRPSEPHPRVPGLKTRHYGVTIAGRWTPRVEVCWSSRTSWTSCPASSTPRSRCADCCATCGS